MAIILYFIFHRFKEEIAEDLALRARLDDEFFYDADSGQKLSLAEVEAEGIVVDEEDLNQVRTAAYIRQNYLEAEWAQELLVNDFKQIGFKYKELSEEDLTLLGETVLLTRADDWSYSKSYYHEKFQIQIVFVCIENYYLNGKYSGSHRFNQLIYWAQSKKFSGHLFLRERDAKDKISGLFKQEHEITIDNFQGFILEPMANENKVLECLKELNWMSDFELEVKGENLFIKMKYLPELAICKEHLASISRVARG